MLTDKSICHICTSVIFISACSVYVKLVQLPCFGKWFCINGNIAENCFFLMFHRNISLFDMFLFRTFQWKKYSVRSVLQNRKHIVIAVCGFILVPFLIYFVQYIFVWKKCLYLLVCKVKLLIFRISTDIVPCVYLISGRNDNLGLLIHKIGNKEIILGW